MISQKMFILPTPNTPPTLIQDELHEGEADIS